MEREPDLDDQPMDPRLARLRAAAPPDPPPELEARLRASLASRRLRRSRVRAAAAIIGATITGSLLAAAALGLWLRPAEQPARSSIAGDTALPAMPPTAPDGDRAIPASPRPGRFRPLNPADDHGVPLTHSARFELAAETAAYLGWPVAADIPRGRVQAEVLYGEDGIARGLRFLPASFRAVPLPHERQ